MSNSPNGLSASVALAELQAILTRHLTQVDRIETQLRSLDLAVSHAMVDLIAAHEPDVVAHAEAVGQIASAIALEMALSPSEVKTVRAAALLHDVGKVGVPDSVRDKPGPLDDAEWEEMRRHPAIGHTLLAKMPVTTDVLLAVRHHHERFDGAGYPDGLFGDEIPLAARIIAVADAYHAMVSDRPYRGRCSAGAARSEIVRCSETQFCPTVVDAFVRARVPRSIRRITAA